MLGIEYLPQTLLEIPLVLIYFKISQFSHIFSLKWALLVQMSPSAFISERFFVKEILDHSMEYCNLTCGHDCVVLKNSDKSALNKKWKY